MKRALLIGLLCTPLAGCLPTAEPAPDTRNEAKLLAYYMAIFNATQTNWTMTIVPRNP